MSGGLSPSEFWELHPDGWWMWYESMLPPENEMYEELYQLVK